MLVMRRRDSCVNIGRASFVVMLDILSTVELPEYTGNRWYTAREALNIALMSDDFPTPDCQS